MNASHPAVGASPLRGRSAKLPGGPETPQAQARPKVPIVWTGFSDPALQVRDRLREVGAALAFKHRDEFSLTWLEGLSGSDLKTAIRWASFYHTEEARQFLERLQKHPEESIRTDAAEALTAW